SQGISGFSCDLIERTLSGQGNESGGWHRGRGQSTEALRKEAIQSLRQSGRPVKFATMRGLGEATIVRRTSDDFTQMQGIPTCCREKLCPGSGCGLTADEGSEHHFSLGIGQRRQSRLCEVPAVI